MSEQQVKVATESEKDAVIDTLKLAFGSDPATRWVWPDPQRYLLHFSTFAEAFGGRAFVNKTAYYVGNYSATALWLCPNIEPDIDTMLRLLHSTTSEEAQNILPRVFEKMGSFHPNEPHWYLPLLGVDPLYYGKGLGSILMKYASKIFDKDNSLAYLESSNPKNIPFYQRHGFEQLGTIEQRNFHHYFQCFVNLKDHPRFHLAKVDIVNRVLQIKSYLPISRDEIIRRSFWDSKPYRIIVESSNKIKLLIYGRRWDLFTCRVSMDSLSLS